MSTYGTDFIKSLKPAHYNYKPGMNLGNKIHFGVMAQDIDKYLKGTLPENSNKEFNIIKKVA